MTSLPNVSAYTADNPPAVFFISQDNGFEPQHAMLSGYDTIALSSSQQVVDSLINRRAAFVFLDARLGDWRPLIFACKNNAATRRIPLCLVSDDGQTRAEAIGCGADLALSWTDLDAQIRDLLAEFARVPDLATMAQLDCECRGRRCPRWRSRACGHSTGANFTLSMIFLKRNGTRRQGLSGICIARSCRLGWLIIRLSAATIAAR